MFILYRHQKQEAYFLFKPKLINNSETVDEL